MVTSQATYQDGSEVDEGVAGRRGGGSRLWLHVALKYPHAHSRLRDEPRALTDGEASRVVPCPRGGRLSTATSYM